MAELFERMRMQMTADDASTIESGMRHMNKEMIAAQEKAAVAERKALAAEAKAEAAMVKAKAWKERAKGAEQRARVAEEGRWFAEERAKAVEVKAKAWEKRALVAGCEVAAAWKKRRVKGEREEEREKAAREHPGWNEERPRTNRDQYTEDEIKEFKKNRGDRQLRSPL